MTESATPAFSLQELRELADFLNDTGMEEVELDRAGSRVRLKRPSATPVAYAPMPVVSSQPAVTGPATGSSAETDSQSTFTSPMVGTFYQSATPEAAPFVKVGDTVKPGQTLCIIEAMKTMNQIESDRAGTVQRILITNATPVEFGQPLFVIA